jgi:hypothetical protein
MPPAPRRHLPLKLFGRNVISSTKQRFKEALGLPYLRVGAENLGSPPLLVAGAADGGGTDQAATPVKLGAVGSPPRPLFSSSSYWVGRKNFSLCGTYPIFIRGQPG